MSSSIAASASASAAAAAAADPSSSTTTQASYQAVVLTEPYDDRFSVLCETGPRCLLPLLGSPLLAWTLESLSLSHARDVVLFCRYGAHVDAVRAWLAADVRHARGLSIQVVAAASSARSAGDCLRQLDQMQLLDPKRPFLLVNGCVVANADLGALVRRHEQIREQDKDVIMTLGIGAGGRGHSDAPTLLVDPASSLLLHYQPRSLASSGSSSHRRRFAIPSKLILDSKQSRQLAFEVWSTGGNSERSRRDLGIDVCEADVPALFSENFDWLDIRRHLVNGVLTSELLGKKIAVAQIPEEQAEAVPPSTGASNTTGARSSSKKDLEEEAAARLAASKLQRLATGGTYVERVKDTRTYHRVARDVLRRYTFPLVPDSGAIANDTTQVELRRGGVYVARDDVRLARTAAISGPSSLGPRTNLGPKTFVRRSVLGAGCELAAGARVDESYLDDNVRLGSGAMVERGCIVGAGVTIGERARVGRGTLIANGVRIGAGVSVPEYSRVGLRPPRGDDEEEDEEEDSDDERYEARPLPGGDDDNSRGYLWPLPYVADLEDATESDYEDVYEYPRARLLADIGRDLPTGGLSRSSSFSTLSHASDSEHSDSDLDDHLHGGGDHDDDDGRSATSSAPSMQLGVPSASDFHIEIRLTLERALTESIAPANLSLELTTLMLSSNVPLSGPGGGLEEIVRFVVEQMHLTPGIAAKEAALAARKTWQQWAPVLVNLKAGGEAILLELQRYAAIDAPDVLLGDGDASPGGVFQAVVAQAYNADVLGDSSDDVFAWATSDAARGAGRSVEVATRFREALKSTGAFLKALQEADEESEEEESEDEE